MVIGDELARGEEAVVADSAFVRRRALRRVFVGAVLLWLAFLWLHQWLDGPGAVVEVGAIEMLDGASAAPAGREELRGAVRTNDGASAADVLVTLVVGEELFWTRTDALGTFALSNLPRGRAHVTLVPIGAPGIEFEMDLPAVEPPQYVLPAAYPPTPVLAEMRGRTLEGRAELPFERSAVGYTVVALPYAVGASGGAPIVAPGLDGRVERRVAIDRSGWFRFDELALGAYELRLLPPWAAIADWPVLGSLVFEHDGRGAVPIVLGNCGALEVTVRDAELDVVAGALVTVTASTDAGLVLPSGATDAAGRVVFEDVPATMLRLEVRAGRLASERTVRVEANQRGVFVIDLVIEAEGR
jgi:hypothetical protein